MYMIVLFVTISVMYIISKATEVMRLNMALHNVRIDHGKEFHHLALERKRNFARHRRRECSSQSPVSLQDNLD